jgi:RNA polymerase sigma factor (sigma-70 family)
MPTIDEVLAAHRAGEEQAANLLVEYCHDRVWWLAVRLLPGFARVARHERPSDVAQEALMGLWQALHRARPDSERHLLLLAGKKVRETLHDLARKHAGQRHGLGNLESRGDVSPDCHPALAAADDVPGPATLDDWTRFHHAIDELPDDEREVMHLKWFVGLSEEEAASVLGRSRSTVQRQWGAAKSRINEALGRERPR